MCVKCPYSLDALQYILRFGWDCPFKDYLSVEAALNILEEAGLEDSLPAHRLSTYRTVEKLALDEGQSRGRHCIIEVEPGRRRGWLAGELYPTPPPPPTHPISWAISHVVVKMTTSPLVSFSVISLFLFHVQGTGRQSRSFLRQQLPSRQQAVPFSHPLVRFLLQVKWGLLLGDSLCVSLCFSPFLSLWLVFAGKEPSNGCMSARLVQIKTVWDARARYANVIWL